jgi:hypothetical protein
LGLQVGIGPPSKAESIGVEIAMYAPNSPTIKTTILIARFIVGLLSADALGAGILTRTEYIVTLVTPSNASRVFHRLSRMLLKVSLLAVVS